MKTAFKAGDIVRIADDCTDPWAHNQRGRLCIVLSDVLSNHPGQEGRLPLRFIYKDGSGTGGSVCFPEFLVPAQDEVALAAKAGYERRMAEEARIAEVHGRERAAIADKHGLAPDVAERFYLERRRWEADHGDE